MKPVRLLLVDDEPEIGAALVRWLSRHGFDVTYAESPEIADALLRNSSFDVILSDIQMPGNFKLEWITRRLSQDCPPPILLMTGNPELDTAMRAANIPVAGYLLKPLFYEETAQLIERLAADHRRREELLELSHEVTRLVVTCDTTSSPLNKELHRLAREFAAEARRSPREIQPGTTADSAPWREAIAETILVLERTKHSFRSKELGELRRRLQLLLPSATPPAPTASLRVPVGAGGR